MSSKENVRHIIKNETVQNKNSGGNISGNSKFYTVKETTIERRVKRPCNNERYKYAKDDLNDMNSEDIEIKIPVSHYSSNNSNQTKKIEVYEYITSNSSKKFSQTQDKRAYTEINERIQDSNPSSKSKYIIETKKVETFKPKYSSLSKIYDEEKNISDCRLKELIKDIWIKKNRFSSVQSISCFGYSNKSSQNDLLLEKYEEEIRKMKNILIEKEKEIKKLVDDLYQNKRIMNLKNKKIYNLNIKNENNYDSFDIDAHELQIISTKLNWNEISQPSPVNEIFIESFKYEYPSSIQYTTDFEIMGKENENNNYEKFEKWNKETIRKEEEFIDKDTISERENILEMQEMAAISIISKKLKQENICQNLGSMIILSNSKDEKSDFSEDVKDEKPISSPGLELIPIEKEPLIFQKIEEINISPILSKNKNKIQELDGLQIINYSKANDKFKNEKKRLEPQCLNELLIPREYDMLLVKPLWNSLMIQRSGLNIIAITKDILLENQEVDEFEIIAQKKKEVIPEKIQVLIPIPDNNIQKLDSFQIIEINKIKRYTEEEVKKIIEKRIKEERIGMDNEIKKLKKEFNKMEIYPEKIDNLNISMEYSTKENKDLFKNLRIGKEKILLKISSAYQKKENKDKFIDLKIGKEKISLNIPKLYTKVQLKNKFTNLRIEKDKLNIKNAYSKIERKNIFENLKIEKEKLNIKNTYPKIERNVFENLRIENDILNIKNSYPKIERNAFKNLRIENDILNIKNCYQKFEKKNVFENLKVEKEKLNIKNSYPKIERKEELEKNKKVNWNDEIKPIKTTKLIVKGINKKLILKIEKKEKFGINLRTKIKKKESDFDIENFALNLSCSDFGKKLKESLKIEKTGFDIERLIKEKKEFFLVKIEDINLKGKKKEMALKKSKIQTVNIKGFGKKDKILKRCKLENINIKGKLKKKISLKMNKIEEINIKGKIKKKEILSIETNNFNVISKKKKWNELNTVMRSRDLNIFNFNHKNEFEENEEVIKIKKEKIVEENENKNRNLKESEEIILKEIKENKLFIEGTKKEENKLINWNEINKLKKEGTFKIISDNKKKDWNNLNIFKKEYTFYIINKNENKEKLERIDWNDMNKIIKKDSISLKNVNKALLYKNDKSASFNILGIYTLKKDEDKRDISNNNLEENINNWYKDLKAQRNSKFSLYGKRKKIQLMIMRGDKFMIQKENEDEIIYNDDYNYLNEREKVGEKKKNEKEREIESSNNKELGKRRIIKEKEILKEKEVIPRIQREIIAQIGRVKEEESEESSSQSEIDVLAGIRNRKIMMSYGDEQLKNSNYGYEKKEINGQVIFTPKSELGVNLGGAQYKCQRSGNTEYYYKTQNKNISGIEIKKQNYGKMIYERMSKGELINQGDYEIIRGNNSSNGYKHISTTYTNRHMGKEKEPKDSKSKNKKQIIINSQANNQNEYNNSRRVIRDEYDGAPSKNNKSLNNVLNSGIIQNSTIYYGLNQGKTKVISMKKEEYYTKGNKNNIDYKKLK